MTETPDDLLAPDPAETDPAPADVDAPADGGDDAPALSAEESLRLLPPD